MTHDELIRSLEVERQDRTFWNLPPAPTSPSSERMRQAIADADEIAVQKRRREALAAVGVDASVDGRGYRDEFESSTSIGAA